LRPGTTCEASAADDSSVSCEAPLHWGNLLFHGLPFDACDDTSGVDKVRYWRDKVKIDTRGR
jgi:hypothetical protein